MNTEILDITSDRKTAPSQLALASKSKRFANLLVDTTLCYILFISLTILLLISDGFFGTTVYNDLFYDPLGDRLIGVIFYFVFFLLVEWGLKGRTIGKFATNTKTIMSDGSPLTFMAILKKSATRLVPFEAFSFFSNDLSGLHDNWSNTVVIDLKKSRMQSNSNPSATPNETTVKIA